MAKFKSANLPPQKNNWHELIDKKFVAIYIALALVLVINQVVFSLILIDRNKAKAETLIFGNDSVGDTNYPELVAKMETIIPPADRNPNQMVIDNAHNFAYIGTSDNAYGSKIIKIRLSDYTRVGEISFPRPSLGFSMSITTALIDSSDTYAYFTFYTFPIQVKRIRLSDFTVDGTLELVGNNCWSAAIDNTNGYAYFSDIVGDLAIERVKLTDFSLDSLLLHTGGDWPAGAVIDEANGFGYFGEAWTGGVNPSGVYKVDLSTFSITGKYTLPTWLAVSSLSLDGDYLWINQSNYPADLIKIKTSDFGADSHEEIVSKTIIYEDFMGGGLYVDEMGGMIIDSTSQLAYLSIQAGWPTHFLLKINLNTADISLPGEMSPLILDSLEGGNVTAFAIDFANSKAYLAGPDYPAYVEKVDLATYTREAVLDLPITLEESRASVIDTTNGYLYVASRLDPPQIAKIRLNDFTLVDILPLDPSLTIYAEPWSAGIDMVHGYAYFGITLRSLPGNPPGLLKIDIDPSRPTNFTVIGPPLDLTAAPVAIPMTSGQMLIDPNLQKAYIGSMWGTEIITVDLATMTAINQITTTASGLVTGVIDLTNPVPYAYFGNTAMAAGRIVKIDLSTNPPSEVGFIDLSAIPNESQFVSSVIDTINGFAYFRGLWGPVVKIRLSDFTRVNAITIPIISGGVFVTSGIDTEVGYAFFSSEDKINTIDIDPIRTYALVNQVDPATRGDILVDPNAGFFYLITKENRPIGVEKYSYTLKGWIYAYKVTVPSPIAMVDYFRFYSNVAAGSLKFALYDSAKNLLWQSNEVINTAAGDWIDVPLSNGTPTSLINLPAGDYYLAFQTNATEPVASQISGGQGFKVASNYSTFPGAIAGETATTNGWSYYAAFVMAPTAGQAPNLVHPADVINLAAKADSTGKVTLTWQDPTADNLKEIIITETSPDGSTKTFIYEKGTQMAVLTNRQIGSKYEYLVKTRDTSGLVSLGLSIEITIPATGEAVGILKVSAEEGSEITLPDGANVGDLIKSPEVTTVYFIDADKRRHAFPNEPTYFTYYTSFANIKILPLSILSQIAIGPNVTVRPGARLVKIQTDPQVYAVEPSNVLRHVSSAEIAQKLYGQDWTNMIIDVASSFFVDYQVGDPLMADSHPTGAVIKYQNDSNVYYFESGKKRLIPSSVFINNKFQTKFIIENFDQTLIYPDGETLINQKIEDIIVTR